MLAQIVELEGLLRDPEGRLTPLSSLPLHVYSLLMYKRQLMYAFLTECKNLVRLGLLSLGTKVASSEVQQVCNPTLLLPFILLLFRQG